MNAAVDHHGWNERYASSAQTFPLDPNRLVAEEVSPLRPGVALDLATGEGRHAVWLAARGWRVLAADFSAVGLAKAQSRARAAGLVISWALADVRRLRFPPATFDLVLAAFFAARPAERPALYPQVAASLRPGGMFLIVGYDESNLTSGSGGPQDPELLLRPSLLADELAALGLEVRRAEAVPATALRSDGVHANVVNAVITAARPSER
ncbi:MAG: class I SAM-dependent methyltransferase [Actinomycetota bacterium]|nr:class I SAM-dependent methyltransferase [Actinomycetota bacterium]